jgi:hypothetical protein
MEILIWVLELVYHEEAFGNLGTPLLFLVYLQGLCIEIWLFVLILVNGYKAIALFDFDPLQPSVIFTSNSREKNIFN